MTAVGEDRPLRLLSLDGGGVRGLSSLYILRYVMYEVKEREKLSVLPKPCDYFDMIAGTSTGGLIAIMLGVLDMDVDTCIQRYSELAKEVFKEGNVISRAWHMPCLRVVLGNARFDHSKLEVIVRKLVETHAKDLLPANPAVDLRDIPMNFRGTPDGTQPKCKVFVCATAERQTATTLFRSYTLKGAAQAGNFKASIVEASRATTAAPFFFEPVTIGQNGSRYVDGAFNYNNPASILKDEAVSIWGDRKVGCLLSIGTGLQQLEDVFLGLEIVRTIKAKVTQTQDTHAALAKQFMEKKGYYRFDVNTGLDKVRLDEAEKTDQINVATHRYMDEQIGAVKECVDQLLCLSIESAQQNWPVYNSYDYAATPKVLFVKPRQAWEKLEQLWAMDRDLSPRRILVRGLPGSGKTTLIDRFAMEHAKEFWAVFRVDASDAERLKAGFEEIAQQLGKDPDKIQLANALSDKPWLLVLDGLAPGVDEVEHITLQANATVLVSTTQRPVHGAQHYLEMKEMDIEEATTLLLRRVSRWSSKVDDAILRRSVQEIVEEDLGCHPLAILQAGGVIETSNALDPADFRERFATLADGPEKLLKRDHDESDYKHASSVWKTFQMCFDDIKAMTSKGDEEARTAANALELIRFFALLGPDVPEEFLLKASIKLHSVKSDGKQTFPLGVLKNSGPISRAQLRLDIIREACSILDRFSLIDMSERTIFRRREYIYRLHAVVRSCVSIDLKTEEDAEPKLPDSWLKATHTLSCALAFNPDISDENLQRLAIPHIAACIKDITLKSKASEYGEAANLDFIWLHFARVYQTNRKPTEAGRLQQEVLDYRQSNSASEVSILEAEHDLASTRRALGDFPGTLKARKEIFIRLLRLKGRVENVEDMEKILDCLPNITLNTKLDNFYLSAMENLAESLNDFRHYGSALKLQQKVVEVLEQTYGSGKRSNERLWGAQAKLAAIHNLRGDKRSSLKIREAIYTAKEQQEPPLSHSLLLSMTEFAHSLHDAGYILRAKKLRQTVFENMVDLHKKDTDHPDLLDAKYHLAASLESFEEWDRALILKKEVLSQRSKIFGEHHRETWKVMSSIAYHYMRRGMHEESKDQHHHVYELCKSHNDPTEALKAEDEVARMESKILFEQKAQLHKQELAKRIKDLHQRRTQILDTWIERFGEDLQGVWNAQNLLLDVQFDFQDFFDREKAQKDRQSLLREQQIRVGNDSSEALQTRDKIANGWSRLNEIDMAIRMYEELASVRTRDQGEQHHETIAVRDTLSELWLRRNSCMEDYKEALAIKQAMLSVQLDSKGSNHPLISRLKSSIQRIESQLYNDTGTIAPSVRTTDNVSRPGTAYSATSNLTATVSDTEPGTADIASLPARTSSATGSSTTRLPPPVRSISVDNRPGTADSSRWCC